MTRTASYATATVPALLVLGFFVWFANWIPQTRWQPPEKHEITPRMTPAELAEMGRTIVRQKGCLACHTLEPGVGAKGQGRGPNLDNLAQRRATGVAGGPGTLVDYLVESLYDPGAYLVESYANIMPVTTGPPAKLTYEEVIAVVDYLQSLGGSPSVRIGDIPRPPGEVAVARAATAGPSEASGTDPHAMLATYECLGCHSLGQGEVLLGPPFDATALREAAARRGVSAEAYVMESIVDPSAVVREGFPAEIMPQDYGERLSAGQLQAMVTYLLGQEGQP